MKEMNEELRRRQSETVEMQKQNLGERLYPLVEQLEVGVVELYHFVNIHIRFVRISDCIYHSCAAPTCCQTHRDACGNGQLGFACFAEFTRKISC